MKVQNNNSYILMDTQFPIVSITFQTIHSIVHSNHKHSSFQHPIILHSKETFAENNIRKHLNTTLIPIRSFSNISFSSWSNTSNPTIFHIPCKHHRSPPFCYGFIIESDSPLDVFELFITDKCWFSLKGPFLHTIHGKQIQHSFHLFEQNIYKKHKKSVSTFCSIANVPDDIQYSILPYLYNKPPPPKLYSYWIPIEPTINIQEEQQNIHTFLPPSLYDDITIHLTFSSKPTPQESNLYMVGFNTCRIMNGIAGLQYV
jgi:hypothetical protein